MKLLIYSHFFAPIIGGVQTIVQSLARALAALRDAKGSSEFEVTVVTKTPAEDYDDSTLPFHVIRQPRFLQLWRLIRNSDVVHLAGPALLPLMMGQVAGKPVVIEHHGFQAICPNGQLLMEPECLPCPGHFMAAHHSKCLRCNSAQGWLASFKLWLLTFVRRFLCARAAANISPTQWLGGLLHLPHISAIPHGLDARPAVSQLVGRPDAPVIAFMGRLVAAKGAILLFKAAKMLQEQNRLFELLIIGDGPLRADLEQFAHDSELAPKVRFAGRLSEAQAEGALSQAAMVVVPSLGGEVFGLIVAENMARGLPIVASDLGAFVEVLGDTGVTFRTGDAADLSTALSRVLQNSSLAAGLGRHARQRALHSFTLGGMINAHASVYRELRAAARRR